MHTKRCTYSLTDKDKCKCSCHGILHGYQKVNKEDHNIRIEVLEDETEYKEY